MKGGPKLLLVSWVIGGLLLNPLPAPCAPREHYLASASIFGAESNLHQRLLKIADTLEPYFVGHDALDYRLINRIRTGDEALRRRLVQEFRREQALFLNFHVVGKFIAMSAKIEKKRRMILFFDRNNVPGDELRSMGLDPAREAKFLAMGFFILPEKITDIGQIRPFAQRHKPVPALFQDAGAQQALENAVRDAVQHFLADKSLAERQAITHAVMSSMHIFSPVEYFKRTLGKMLLSNALLGVLILPSLGPVFTACALVISLASYIGNFMRLWKDPRAWADTYRPFPWILFKPVCFLKWDPADMSLVDIRSNAAHEIVHLFKYYRLIRSDVPTANVYQTYLMLLYADTERRTALTAEGFEPELFYLQKEDIQRWDSSAAFGLERGLQSWISTKILERELFNKALDSIRGIAWLKFFRPLQKFLGTFGGRGWGRERRYAYFLGAMYGGIAYAYARRAGNPEAGFEFVRLIAQGNDLEHIHRHIVEKFHLKSPNIVLREMTQDYVEGGLIEGSL